MALITKPKTWADNENVTYTDLNGTFDGVYNEVNGALSDANLSATAGIASTKIASTLSDKTISNSTALGSKATITTASDGTTVTFDLNAGPIHQVTLGGNRTLAISNGATGKVFMIRIIQDATGSRTVTWFSTIKWIGGAAPTLSTAANAIDVFSFICTGTGTYDGFIVGMGLA